MRLRVRIEGKGKSRKIRVSKGVQIKGKVKSGKITVNKGTNNSKGPESKVTYE